MNPKGTARRTKPSTVQTKPRTRHDGEMYKRPCALDGFPNPFTFEYCAGYKDGKRGEAMGALHHNPEYRAGYRDGIEQDALDMITPYREDSK